MIFIRNLEKFFFKFLLCSCLFLGLGIICKININYKDYIENKIYHEYFDFSMFKFFYNKYLGGVFPFNNIANSGVISVFDDDLTYKNISSYKDGAVLEVNYNYLVPNMYSGIVVYVGEKDGYGKVVIVEGNNGVDVWYGNMCNIMVELYDVVNNGDYLGDVCDNKLYVVYTKKNIFLDYRDYLN